MKRIGLKWNLEKSKYMFNISKIKLELPRTLSRQTLQENIGHISTEEYYSRSIFLPLLYTLLQQLNDYFQGKTMDAIKGIYLIPSNNEKLTSEKEKQMYCATDLINNGTDFDQEISI